MEYTADSTYLVVHIPINMSKSKLISFSVAVLTIF